MGREDTPPPPEPWSEPGGTPSAGSREVDPKGEQKGEPLDGQVGKLKDVRREQDVALRPVGEQSAAVAFPSL